MRLRLVLKGPGRLMGAQPEKTLEHGSLVIGRSPSSGWVLPDPERVVSKAHCRIDRDAGGFVVTDTSTNGVTVDGRQLGYGVSSTLSGGERLELGDAVVEVHLDAAAPAMPERDVLSEPARDPGVLPIAAGGPFGVAAPVVEAPSVAVAPPPHATGQAGLPDQKILDDWWTQEGAETGGSAPKSVDIFTQGEGNASLPASTPTDSEESSGGTVEFLVQSRADIDLIALAQAVDEAGRLLSETEWRSFHERLRDLLARPGGRQV